MLGETSENIEIRTSKNYLLHKSNENTGGNYQEKENSTFSEPWELTKGLQKIRVFIQEKQLTFYKQVVVFFCALFPFSVTPELWNILENQQLGIAMKIDSLSSH